MRHLKSGWPHPACMNVLHIDRNVTKRIESIQEVLLYLIYWCIHYIWTDIDECTTGQHTCHHHALCLNNEVSKKIGGHQSFFVWPLVPLFWTFGDVCPGLQSQGGTFTCMLRLLHAMAFSDSPVVRDLLTSWWPSIATLRFFTSSTSIK